MNITIIIPARDEELCLPKCLEAINKSAAHANISVEIIVVANRCTDRTEEIALRHGCRVIRDDSKNLSIIRNAGVSAASNQWIVTVDADSYMSVNLLSKVVRILSSERNIGGGTLMFPERLSLGIALTFLCLIPIAIWHRITGGLFYFRKDDFQAIGGFNAELYSAEDIDFARRLKAFGKQTGRKFRSLFTAYIITSTRKFDRFGDWYFLLRPLEMIRLLHGKDKKAADKIWYDFTRDEK